MKDARLAEWMHVNGLTAEECAMIQPEYYWSGGPGLKNNPVDSLAPVVSRAIIYSGKPDSCVVGFTITAEGKLENETVKSGNRILGNAVIVALRGLEYTASWSSGMGDPKHTSPSDLQLKFYHGIAPPPVPADSLVYETIKTTGAVKPGENDKKTRLTGRVNWKGYSYYVGNVRVRALDEKGRFLGETKTDGAGNFNFDVLKGDYKNITLEFDLYGGKKVVVTGIPPANADMNVEMEGVETFGNAQCSDFYCMTDFYLAPPPRK
jgi:hypothetical protein